MASHDDDDIFADTRMSFGDHIEELRGHLIRAMVGIAVALVGGLTLDGIGWAVDIPWLGVGKPVMDVIKQPVREQLQVFYDERIKKLEQDAGKNREEAKQATDPKPMSLGLSPAAVALLRGQPAPPADAPGDLIWVDALVKPLEVYTLQKGVANIVRPPELTTLNVQEGMVVYIKVCLTSSLVLASPYVFWELWSFVAAGLYPHEKKHVHRYLPVSIGLFLFGVALCQYAVLPKSIEALLWFNQWLGFTPDLRLNEWMSFAIFMPVVFGIAFQTPLIMLFLERIGVMTVETYLSYWKAAIFILAVFAAVITPSVDLVSLACMWVPLCGLYFLGIYLCRLSPRTPAGEGDLVDSEFDGLIGV